MLSAAACNTLPGCPGYAEISWKPEHAALWFGMNDGLSARKAGTETGVSIVPVIHEKDLPQATIKLQTHSASGATQHESVDRQDTLPKIAACHADSLA